MAMKSANPLTVPSVPRASKVNCTGVAIGCPSSVDDVVVVVVVGTIYNSFSHTKTTIDPSFEICGSITLPGTVVESTI